MVGTGDGKICAIYVISRFRPLVTVRHYTQIFQPNSVLPAVLIDIIDLYHFTPLSVASTLTQSLNIIIFMIIIIIIIIIITIIIIIIKNLIYIAQFDTNGILIALYLAIQYIQMQYVHK